MPAWLKRVSRTPCTVMLTAAIFHLRHDAEQQPNGIGCVEQHAGVRVSVCVEQRLAHPNGRHAHRWRARSASGRTYRLCVLATQYLCGVRAVPHGGQDVFVLRTGQDISTPGAAARLSGNNPYWRFAYNAEWGPHSLMLGTYGLVADKYPDDTMPVSPTDRFTDYAFDTQYQYLTFTHSITAQATWIHKK